MSGGAGPSSDAALVVTAELDYSESALVRELVGDQEALREVEMGEDSGSELSELESSVVGAGEMEVDARTGRPNFTRAATGAGRRVESTQEFFRRGGRKGHSNGADDDDAFFTTPGKQAMRGALARSLSAVAASSPQQVGAAETLNLAKSFEGEDGKLDVGASGWAEETANEDAVANEDEMEGVKADGWAEEMANKDEMEGVDRSGTPTPTPARWPTPAPVTPAKGRKRMAIGTPRRTRNISKKMES